MLQPRPFTLKQLLFLPLPGHEEELTKPFLVVVVVVVVGLVQSGLAVCVATGIGSHLLRGYPHVIIALVSTGAGLICLRHFFRADSDGMKGLATSCTCRTRAQRWNGRFGGDGDLVGAPKKDAPVYVTLFAHSLMVTAAEQGERPGFATTSHEYDSFIQFYCKVTWKNL